jgi:23S rRNA (guanosine2251-2'-O)-methyltransferase
MGQMLIGRKPVIEALRSGKPIERIDILQGIRGGVIEELRRLAEQRNVPLAEVDRQAFRQVAADATTQGVIAFVPTRPPADLDQILAALQAQRETGFFLVLDQIEDPQNLGALVRTAECAGVHCVITPKHHAAGITGTVVKASAGATEHIPIAEVTNIVAIIEQLKEAGFWVIGLASEGQKTYEEPDYTLPIVMVVGSEGRGIRRLVKEHCDHLVHIPLFGKVGSLNASVAGALGMYEVVRQRSRQSKQGEAQQQHHHQGGA